MSRTRGLRSETRLVVEPGISAHERRRRNLVHALGGDQALEAPIRVDFPRERSQTAGYVPNTDANGGSDDPRRRPAVGLEERICFVIVRRRTDGAPRHGAGDVELPRGQRRNTEHCVAERPVSK